MEIEEGCPCQSGKTYSLCCSSYHQGVPAPTALALMRSRYAAYALKKIDYLVNTTHLSTRKNHPYEAIEKWANQTAWKGLEIIGSQKGTETEVTGIVEFKARFNDGGSKDDLLHESSNFIKENGKWYYVDGKHRATGISEMKVGRNAPCTCGSGKKFKKCCG